MAQHTRPNLATRFSRFASVLLAAFVLLTPAAWPLRMIGGDSPISDGDFPPGSARVANSPNRYAVWSFREDHHFLFAGKDSAAFQADLDAFAAIDSPRRELCVYDGPTSSTFGMNIGPTKDKKTDWEFLVWDSRNFYLNNRPKDPLKPSMYESNINKPLPSPRLSVYFGAGSHVDWTAIRVPAGVTLLDRRVDASQWPDSKGGVVSVAVRDMTTSAPLAGVMVEACLRAGSAIVPQAAAISSADGSAVIRDLAPGTYVIRLSCAGFAPRVLGSYENYARTLGVFDDASLSPAAELSGRVVDAKGAPLAGVEVRTEELLGADGTMYDQNQFFERSRIATAADGRFQITGLPKGKIDLFAIKQGFLNGPRVLHPVPGPEVSIAMTSSGSISGRVLEITPLAADEFVCVAVLRANDTMNPPPSIYHCDADGNFVVEYLKAGDYTLHAVVAKGKQGAFSMNGSADANCPVRKVTINDGQSLQVDLHFNAVP